mmetsp:Transcript_11360/g.16976  ORF Transcript_11360/g.16976 Transcript_11360/m.16976 type:complete len:380 (-) Transcript_11360:167-1306(-)|eukprot:CAMPEP_0167759914 /NCGR_PEP_ID=MMETSP0110_2-20121227/11289_1 /TAXON_ID=629695 /ORGANISM="Gymnochlora sp., Strain CCMP2014" /LENGTH=379 /DNA_ID=CAMNT_0007646355 /DNA_START=78 /DNA_END=1217 /DNA_ORIENTATION=-
MEAFLTYLRLTKLTAVFKEEGIDDPSTLADLEEDDIADFLRSLKDAGVKLTLGEKSRFRKAWKQLKATGTYKSPSEGKDKGKGMDIHGSETLAKLLEELRLSKYTLSICDQKLWAKYGKSPSLTNILELSSKELDSLLDNAGFKPGHKARLERALKKLRVEKGPKPRYFTEFKISASKPELLGIGKRTGKLLRLTKTKDILVQGVTPKFGITLYPERKVGSTAEVIIPPDIKAGEISGSVAIDDCQKGSALGKGIRFRLTVGPSRAEKVLFVSPYMKAKGIEHRFKTVWNATMGTTLKMTVECSGLNVNCPAIWVNPNIIPSDRVADLPPQPPVQPVFHPPFHPPLPQPRHQPPQVYPAAVTMKKLQIKKMRRATGIRE